MGPRHAAAASNAVSISQDRIRTGTPASKG